jgi:hypothetical protein
VSNVKSTSSQATLGVGVGIGSQSQSKYALKLNIPQLTGVGVGVGQIPPIKSFADISGQFELHGNEPLKKQSPSKTSDRHQ